MEAPQESDAVKLLSVTGDGLSDALLRLNILIQPVDLEAYMINRFIE
jgi:hypothetical protein